MSEIVEIDAATTHPLRRALLRDGTASDVVVFEGDDLATTFHIGLRRDGRLVGISTWLALEYPGDPGRPAVQLRGMAVTPECRGEGAGTDLLRAGLARCRDSGALLVWARARTSALGFYLGHGFDTVGEEYVDATTGLDHRDIVLDLEHGS